MHGAVVGIEIHVGCLDDEPAAARHGVARVDREVYQNLLELSGIDSDRTRVSVEARDELDVVPDDAAEHSVETPDQFIEV